jgi:hypothetical protein
MMRCTPRSLCRSFVRSSNVKTSVLRTYSLRPVQESNTVETTPHRRRRILQVAPVILAATAGALYCYWRFVLVERDKECIERYITSHHTQIIENAVRTGLASVNHPLNLEKTLASFAYGEKYNPITSKIQMAVMQLRKKESTGHVDPKDFFDTDATITYTLLPEIVHVREGISHKEVTKLRVGSPYTVLHSRQCLINVKFPITVVDSSETVDENKVYPVVAMHVEMRNLNSRLDRFIPQFFITKISLQDAQFAFPDAPQFVDKIEQPSNQQINIEEALSVDGQNQVGDGVVQKTFNLKL